MEVRRLDPPVREYDCPECERWCEVLVSNAVGHDRIDLPKHSPLGGDGRRWVTEGTLVAADDLDVFAAYHEHPDSTLYRIEPEDGAS